MANKEAGIEFDAQDGKKQRLGKTGQPFDRWFFEVHPVSQQLLFEPFLDLKKNTFCPLDEENIEMIQNQRENNSRKSSMEKLEQSEF